MKRVLQESEIIKAVAEEAANKVTRRAIRSLQEVDAAIAEFDLVNFWEEICAQVQYHDFFCWYRYEEMIRAEIRGQIEELAQHEREAIWLQSDEGSDGRFEETGDRDPYPVLVPEIVEHVIQNYFFRAAKKWSNPRIRKYLRRVSLQD